jgi:hypothetical protein
MSEHDLLPCPFCGAAPELIEADTGAIDVWLVRCTDCQCKTVNYYGKAQPIFVWNKRINPLVRRERCPACGHTHLVYKRLAEPRCTDPWHGGDVGSSVDRGSK